jgi:hypothetical protein
VVNSASVTVVTLLFGVIICACLITD